MRILVLTSGGDNPGINTFLAYLDKKNKDTFACQAGYKGLINGDIMPLSSFSPQKFAATSGSVIKSSRCPEFKEIEYFNRGLEQARKYDALIILGGNGSYEGAKRLAEHEIRTIFVPSTIDNDVKTSQYSLGFDTAVTACVETINNSMPTFDAFNRCGVFEVMGRDCPAIANACAQKVGCDFLAVDKKSLSYPKMVKAVKEKYKQNHGSCVIVKEKIAPIQEICDKIQEKSGVTTRGVVIGYVQRGRAPTKFDMKTAIKFAKLALQMLKKSKNSYALALNDCKFSAHLL